ncbi:hypothetical protein A6R68_21831, partial [Neotoma lepida]
VLSCLIDRVSTPTGYDQEKCQKIFHPENCTYSVVEKENPEKSCVVDAWVFTLSDTSSQTPKLRKMDNSKAAENNPPSQDTLAISEAPFPTPENSYAHQKFYSETAEM